MGRLSACPFCEGRGLLTFESGPAVEPCRECDGSGQIYDDPAYRGLFSELLREKGVLLDADIRLLLLGLEALEARLTELEAAIRTL